MYKLLTENTKMRGGDLVISDDENEMIIISGGGWDGCKVKELWGWKEDVVAVLRPIKEK